MRTRLQTFVCAGFIMTYLSHVMRKPVFQVCHQVTLKLACSATEASYSLGIFGIPTIDIILSRDADQTSWMHKLICIFNVHKWHKTGFLMTWLIYGWFCRAWQWFKLHGDNNQSRHIYWLTLKMQYLVNKSIFFFIKRNILSRLTTKPTKWHVCPAKTQISLGICPVWPESLLSAWRS